MTFIKTTQTPATAENKKWLRIRLFTNFSLQLQTRVRKYEQSCRSRLRHSVATSARHC